jgi:DNA repair photolyase
MLTSVVEVRSILTRTTGYLKTVCSHSLQPYRGCPFGKALCGVGCYVQHNQYVTKGRPWGSFLEVRANAAEVYTRDYSRERNWARRSREGFVIFLSSATEPFPPAESRHKVTAGLLVAMIAQPPDGLIVQTHSHRVVEHVETLKKLASMTSLRVHVSIETDLDVIPGLPPHASPVAARFDAVERLKREGIRVIITVSPLLPIGDPERFFGRISQIADGVVIDHFIGGDGSANGSRTLRTALPNAMNRIDPESTELPYRDRMCALARRFLPGRVGTHIDGFADRNWT